MSDYRIVNRRRQHRYSSVAGVIPTIPGTGATSLYYPDSTWANTDIMIGELFINSEDERVWFRTEDNLIEMGYSGQTGNFVSLADAPSSYAGYGTQFVRVNTGETALEFYNYTGQTFTLTDATDFLTPPTSADTGKYLQYSWTNSGFSLNTVNTNFTDLSDTPSGYTGANYLLKINSGNTGLEFFDGKTQYADITTTNTFASAITFNDDTTFTNIDVNGSITLSGLTNNVEITDIQTGTGFTIVNENTLATTYNIYSWVNSLVQSGLTGLTSFVTLDTTQTITGTKTFDAATSFGNNINVTGDANITTDINVSGNTYNGITSYQYIGDSTTIGSYRMYINPSGDLQFDKLISGSTWEFRASL